MTKKKHLIIGGDSLLGEDLYSYLKKDVNLYKTSRRIKLSKEIIYFDLNEIKSWENLPKDLDIVYFLIGKTSIKECQDDQLNSYNLNVVKTHKLFQYLRYTGCHIIMLSTNQVFNGDIPFSQINNCHNPQNIYAEQKSALEKLIQQKPGYSVLRISKIIDSLKLLINWKRDLLLKKNIYPFFDLYCAPISVKLVSKFLFEISKQNSGRIYQLSGDKDLSYLDIAMKLAAKLDIVEDLITAKSYNKVFVNQIKPGKYSTLSVKENPIGFDQNQNTEDLMDRYLSDIVNNNY